MNKVLLVEDDKSLGYILKEYLQMHDFEVVWAQDGEAGMEEFKKSLFEISGKIYQDKLPILRTKISSGIEAV